MTVAKEPGRRGEREVSRKPPCREGRIASAEPVCSCAFSICILHARPRVQRAPGFPCALYFSGGSKMTQTSGALRREIEGPCRPTTSSRRTPGPITTGLCCCAKAFDASAEALAKAEQHLPKRATRRMGPGVRRDDGRRSRCYPNSYSPRSNLDVIFQYSTSRHGVIAKTRPFGLRYQLVMPLWVHTMRACMASTSRL